MKKKLQVLDGLFSGFLNLSDLILTNSHAIMEKCYIENQYYTKH